MIVKLPSKTTDTDQCPPPPPNYPQQVLLDSSLKYCICKSSELGKKCLKFRYQTCMFHKYCFDSFFQDLVKLFACYNDGMINLLG